MSERSQEVHLVYTDGRSQIVHAQHEPYRVPILQPIQTTLEPAEPVSFRCLEFSDCRCIDRVGRSVWTIGGTRPPLDVGVTLRLLKRTQRACVRVWLTRLVIDSGHVDADEMAAETARGALQSITGCRRLYDVKVRPDPVNSDNMRGAVAYIVMAEGLLPYLIETL